MQYLDYNNGIALVLLLACRSADKITRGTFGNLKSDYKTTQAKKADYRGKGPNSTSVHISLYEL